MKVRTYSEVNDSRSTIYQNMYDIPKAVNGVTRIALEVYTTKYQMTEWVLVGVWRQPYLHIPPPKTTQSNKENV